MFLILSISEGCRSRTGKPSLPKAGLLSFLVEAIREGQSQ